MTRTQVLLPLIISAAFLCACGGSNNLLLGEVRALVGTHDVTVTDCYRFHVDPPRLTAAGFEYTPCRDARVQLQDEQLVVNGIAYGRLRPSDRVLVDHGKVLINERNATPLPSGQ